MTLPVTSLVSPEWGRRYWDRPTEAEYEAILRIYRCLTDRQRIVVWGLCVNGYREAEFAELLGLSRNRVAWIKRTALARMRAELSEDEAVAS